MQKNADRPAYVKPIIKFNFELFYEEKEKIESKRSITPKQKSQFLMLAKRQKKFKLGYEKRMQMQQELQGQLQQNQAQLEFDPNLKDSLIGSIDIVDEPSKTTSKKVTFAVKSKGKVTKKDEEPVKRK